MLTFAEISGSLYAITDMVRGRPHAMKRLDTSYEGFWRSFLVIILLLPFFGIVHVAERHALIENSAMTEDLFPTGRFLVLRVLGTLVDFVDFPLLLALIGGLLGISRRYVPYVVALNWLTPLIVIPSSLIYLVYLIGLYGIATATELALLVSMVGLWLEFLVTRATLQVSIAFAIGLVAMHFALSIVAILLVSRLAGV